eukprot:2765678-Rhodomonas_salina.2
MRSSGTAVRASTVAGCDAAKSNANARIAGTKCTAKEEKSIEFARENLQLLALPVRPHSIHYDFRAGSTVRSLSTA